MIGINEFIDLPFTPDLIEGGIAFACRSLAISTIHNAVRGSMYPHLRGIVGAAAVELAFRRYLGEKGVPFSVKNPAVFTEPDRYDVTLGGHRCYIHTSVISRRSQTSAILQNKELVLQELASIPEALFIGGSHLEQELNLFAFLLGVVTGSPEETRKALDAGQQTYILHTLKQDWARPTTWEPLGRLVMKSESDAPLKVEICGQDKNRQLISETITLDPLMRASLQSEMYSLLFVHTDRLPEARLGIHSARKKAAYIVQPFEWGNIWIYGLEIILAGYMPRDEFRRKANQVSAGTRVFQYSSTQSRSLSVPISSLHSLDDLFSRVVEWNARLKKDQ